MGERREAKKTPVAPADMVVAMKEAWCRRFGSEPSPGTVHVLIAHWALETAWGRSMVCNNVGNVKAPRTDQSYDFCYFRTWEIMSTSQADAFVRSHPATAKIAKYTNGGRKARVDVYPDNPACRFKAFDTLADGCADHLALIEKRFSRSWPALLTGDPAAFSRALKSQRYYTADEAQYTALLVANFRTASRDPDAPPTIRKGSKGDPVARWQCVIGVAADGDFGPKTEAATKAWQSARGLTADGIVGPATWATATKE